MGARFRRAFGLRLRERIWIGCLTTKPCNRAAIRLSPSDLGSAISEYILTGSSADGALRVQLSSVALAFNQRIVSRGCAENGVSAIF